MATYPEFENYLKQTQYRQPVAYKCCSCEIDFRNSLKSNWILKRRALSNLPLCSKCFSFYTKNPEIKPKEIQERKIHITRISELESLRGISNFRVFGDCEKCQKPFSFLTKDFLKRDLPDVLCNSCYLDLRCYSNPEWLEKNSQAQLIAQNLPEQKIKNAEEVSKSWTRERKAYQSKLSKDKWANSSPEEKENFLKGLAKHAQSDSFYSDCILNGFAKHVSGHYNGIPYASFLELSFILECEDRGIPIRGYNKEPIPYVFNGVERRYYPDFIIFDAFVIEIKGNVFKKSGGMSCIETKEAAARKYLTKHGLRYRLFFQSKFLKHNLPKAKRIHENSLQENSSI